MRKFIDTIRSLLIFLSIDSKDDINDRKRSLYDELAKFPIEKQKSFVDVRNYVKENWKVNNKISEDNQITIYSILLNLFTRIEELKKENIDLLLNGKQAKNKEE